MTFFPKIDNYKLGSDDLHLWFIHTPGITSQIERRLCLKKILNTYLSQDKLVILESTHGKPYIQDHPLQFNLSHSRDYMILALHHQFPLGIDIEYLKPRDFNAFTQRFWPKLDINSYPSYYQAIAFYQAWTITEAWVKMHGASIFNHPKLTLEQLLLNQVQEDEPYFRYSFMPKLNYMASIYSAGPIMQIQATHLDLRQSKDWHTWIK